MCDELTAKDAEIYLRRKGLTRREFNKRGAGVALAMFLPPVAHALDVTLRLCGKCKASAPAGNKYCYRCGKGLG